MSVTFESGQDILFLKLDKEDKNNFQFENKVNNIYFSSYPSFVFSLYTLISPSLQIILEEKLHIQVDLKEVPQSLK